MTKTYEERFPNNINIQSHHGLKSKRNYLLTYGERDATIRLHITSHELISLSYAINSMVQQLAQEHAFDLDRRNGEFF